MWRQWRYDQNSVSICVLRLRLTNDKIFPRVHTWLNSRTASRLFVCLSVCRLSVPNSRKESFTKFKSDTTVKSVGYQSRLSFCRYPAKISSNVPVHTCFDSNRRSQKRCNTNYRWQFDGGISTLRPSSECFWGGAGNGSRVRPYIYGHAYQCVWLSAWRFLLMSYNNHSCRMQ